MPPCSALLSSGSRSKAGALLVASLFACGSVQGPRSAEGSRAASALRGAQRGFRVELCGYGVRLVGYAACVDADGGTELTLAERHSAAPWRWGPRRFWRGTRPLAERIEAIGVRRGVLRIERGALDEVLDDAGGQLEQRWELPRPPAGEGDLTVRFASRSLQYRSSDEAGLHFVDSLSGRGLRYGHGTWIDSTGQRARVVAEYDAGDIVLRVPHQVVERSTYPAVLDPIVSAEFGVDTPVTVVDKSYKLETAVAFGAGNYFVVWSTNRAGQSDDLFATRVTASGTVLDPIGFPVVMSPVYQRNPAVAFGGSQFLVVWDEGNLGVDTEIRGLRFDAQGQPLDAAPFIIAPAQGSQVRPAVASDGSGFLVAWVEQRTGNGDIYAARVSAMGQVLDTAGIAVSTGPTSEGDVSVGFDGTRYLVAWVDSRGTDPNIYAARVSTAGTVLDPTGIRVGSIIWSRDPKVASDGNLFLVAYTEYQSSTGDVRAVRVDGAGTVLDTTPLVVTNISGTTESVGSVAWDGSRFLIAYESATVYVARVTSAGAVTAASGPLVAAAGTHTSPSLASDGTRFFGAWLQRNASNDVRLLGARIEPATGAAIEAAGFNLVSSANVETAPALAFDGTQYLVAWEDNRGPQGIDIYAARVSATGTLLDPAGIAVSTAAGDQTEPSIAAGAGVFLVSWTDGRPLTETDLYAARVSAAGTVLDPSGIPVSTRGGEQTQSSVGFGANTFLVGWTDRGGAGSRAQIYAARVTPTGAVSDAAGLVVSTTGRENWEPSIGFAGNVFLVGWYGDTTTFLTVYAARISPAGAVLDAPLVLASAMFGRTGTQVATDNTGFMVAWNDGRPSGGQSLYAGRVDVAGNLLDPGGFEVAATSVNRRFEAIAFDGTDYVLAFTTGVSAGVTTASAIRLSVDGGSAVDAAAWALVPGTTSTLDLARGGGRLLATYSAFDSSPAVLATRVKARFIDMGTLAAPTLTSPMEAETTSAQPTFAGLAPGATRVRLSVANVAVTTTVSAGAFAMTWPAALAAGAHSVSAISLDGADNVSPPSATVGFFVDTQRPVDAGSGDAGLQGTGGGVGSDGGPLLPDGGAVATDGGATGSPRSFAVGCGCGGAPAAPLLLLVGLGCLARRRFQRCYSLLQVGDSASPDGLK